MVLELAPDDLPVADVGPWAEQKYRRMAVYCEIFARAMKGKWRRVYVDLFSGAGRARIRGRDTVLATSPTIALQVTAPFDHYIFCEKIPRRLEALRARVRRDHPAASVTFVTGDTNSRVTEIARAIPEGSLSLCMVDPYAISNLDFSTIRALSRFRMDFLVLIPSHMDANRNQERLRQPDYPLLDRFLGNRAWREEWTRMSQSRRPPSFGTFLVDQFGKSMLEQGYRYDGPEEAEAIRDGTRLLYYLALYSRHPLGSRFWREAVRSGSPQLPLFGRSTN